MLKMLKNLTFEINDKYIISDDRKDWKTVYKEKDQSFFLECGVALNYILMVGLMMDI